VIVVVWSLADRTGIELIRRLRAQLKDAAILALGLTDGVDERIAALDAGADDVMCLPVAFRELMARVRAVLRRRDREMRQSLLVFADLALDSQTHLVTRDRRAIELTLREFALLELFLRHPRQVLTREVMLANVWGTNYAGDENVVEVYVHTLREKLGDQPPRLIQTVRGIGYMLHERTKPERERHSQRRVAQPDRGSVRQDGPTACGDDDVGTAATARRLVPRDGPGAGEHAGALSPPSRRRPFATPELAG
jgi:DNA-binding response OmpR family regulator